MKIPRGDKMRFVLRRDGVRGGMRAIFRHAVAYFMLSEDHVWCVVDLMAERPKPQLAPDLTLKRLRHPDVRLLEGLRLLTPSESAARLEAGNDLWLVLGGDLILFSCWVFRGQTPVIAAAGGHLTMPSDVVSIEDSEAIPAARGRGIGPATWAAILDAMADEGKRWVITKIAVDNAPSRRGSEKAGFEAAALMHFRRRGPRSHTSLEPLESPRAGFIMDLVSADLR